MARTWIEPYMAEKHINHMPEVCNAIDPQGQVIVVEEGKFRLEFLSLKQLNVAIEYFSKKDGGSARLNASGGDHWEFQPWQCRLPAGINNKHHRSKILHALESARALYDRAGVYRASCT